MFVKCKRERERNVIEVIVRERERDVIDVIVRFLIRNVGFFIRNVGFLIRNVGFLDFFLETSDFVTRHTSFRHTSFWHTSYVKIFVYDISVHSEAT